MTSIKLEKTGSKQMHKLKTRNNTCSHEDVKDVKVKHDNPEGEKTQPQTKHHTARTQSEFEKNERHRSEVACGQNWIKNQHKCCMQLK